MSRWVTLVLVIGLLLLCVATVVFAQDDTESLIKSYAKAPSVGVGFIYIAASALYLALYAGCLIVTCSYLQRFTGFDGWVLLWIGVLWLGGMVANYLGYAVAGENKFLAVLIAAPLIFGWVVLISTRSWADLSLREALLAAAVIVVICAPYFGPTWPIIWPNRQKPEQQSEPEDETRLVLPARPQLALVPATPDDIFWGETRPL